MSKRFLKVLSLVLSLMMITSLFAACGRTSVGTEGSDSGTTTAAVAEQTTTAAKQLEPVKLKYYNIGDPSPRWEAVLAEVNKLMQAKINATIEANFLAWGDYQTKYPLITASGEAYDFIYTSNWAFFQQEGNKGAFMGLDKLLPKSAPRIWKDCPADAWESAKLNGKIFMIPGYLSNIASVNGIYYREDLRKKYQVPEIKSIVDFEAFFDAIKKNEPSMIPINLSSTEYSWFAGYYLTENDNRSFLSRTGGMSYKLDDAACKLSNFFHSSALDEWAVTAKKWANKGFWSANSLSNKTVSKESFDAGTSAAGLWTAYDFNERYKNAKKTHPDWEVGFYLPLPKDGGKLQRAPYNNNGVAIGANSKNPDRALMAIESLLYDEAIALMGAYGVEGVDHEASGNAFVIPDGKAADQNYSFGNLFGMGFPNIAFERDAVFQNSEYYNSKLHNMDYYLSITTPARLGNFNINTEAIKSELAAINQLRSNYEAVIDLGFSKDPAATLKEFRDELNKAGLEKVTKVLQEQVDTYLAGNK